MKKLKRKLSLLTALLMLGSFAPQSLAETEAEQNMASEPEVLFYRDYEEYTGGIDIASNGKNHGTMNFLFNEYKKSVPADSFDGIGVKLVASHGSERGYLPDSVGNGILYMTLLSEGSDDPKVGEFYFGQNNADMAFFAWRAGQFTYNNNKAWGSDQPKTAMQGASTSYKIDVVMNLTDQTRDVYINGQLIYGNAKFAADLREGCMTLVAKNGCIIDDFAMVYFPEDVMPQTFSVTKAEADAKADVIRVFLKSDAVDSDGQDGNPIAAPYGITLPNEDAMNASYIVAEDSFNVLGMNVLEVERGLRAGEYVLTVDGDIKTGEEYTVIANSDLVGLMGETLNPLNNGATVTAGEAFSGEVKKTNGNNIIEFNDDVYNIWDYKKGATVKNLYTGETGTVTLSKNSSNSAMISGYDFVSGDEYVITLPDNLRGKGGNTIENNEIAFNLGVGGSLKKLNLVDILGEKHTLADINPVALDALEFNFTNDVEAEEFVSKIKITETATGEEFTDYVAECNDNVATLKLNTILAGGKTYTISITGLIHDYSITVKTEEESFRRLPVQFLDSEGNSLKSMEDVKVGDTVSVKLGFVNSTSETKDFLVSACLFSGQELTGFDFEEVSMDSVADGGTGKKTCEFDFTVEKITGDLKLKGYMWSESDGKFAPIEAVSTFE